MPHSVFPPKSKAATKFPEDLPSAAAVKCYELLKASLISKRCTATEQDCKKQLRDLLMERCRLQIPWMQHIQQERQRLRAAAERAKWSSCATPPTADDVGQLDNFEEKCIAESLNVKEEAEWLGRVDGAPGLGARIWPIAFELHAKAAKLNSEKEQLLRNHHEKTLKAYAERTAKPWPSELPGIAQRVSYEQLKASTLRDLSAPAQAAMLQSRSAPHIIGAPASRQLRAALMARCQQIVPVIQRLQCEGKAFNTAATQGQVDDQDAARFLMLETNTRVEINAVKAEAEWLSDDAGISIGMGDHIWPAALEIHAKKRAQISKQIQVAQISHPQDKKSTYRCVDSLIADVID